MKLTKTVLFTIISVILVSLTSCSPDGSPLFPIPGTGPTIDPNNFEVTETIGSEGGVVVVGEQNSVSANTFISIPAGALTEATEITMKGVNPTEKGITFQGKTDGIFVEFGPHGTTFDKPVQIGIPFLDGEAGNKKIYYHNTEKNRWEPLPILAIDTENNIIIAETNHFSTYTVQGSNLLMDVNLYQDGGNLYGAVKLLTPMDQVTLDGGSLNELMIQQPQNVRAAFRVSLKKQTFALPDPLGDWFDKFVPATEVVTHYYRVDQVLGPLYIVEAEDEAGTVLLNSLTRGDNLDFAGMERYYSGEPLLFTFAMPANTSKKYYLTVDLYYLKGDVSIDDATEADIWGGQGHRVISYSSAANIPAMDPVSDVDQNGDGVVDTSSDGTTFDHIPSVSISTPATDITATEGDSVTFIGTATDLEDGPLTGASLIWTSDIDGQIGTGDSFDTSVLSVNTHTITLSVTDSVGNTGTATVMVNVEPMPPVITARSPEPDAIGVAVGSSIYVTFSKDMDAGTINGTNFIVTDSDAAVITGVYDYSNKVASFTPTNPWGYGKTYTVTLTTGILDTVACPMTAEASWNFLAESVKIELEDVSFESNGAGYFGGPLNRMAKNDGNELLDTVDFSYGFDLLSIYDTGNSGAFQSERYMRVVENALNASNAGGLNLTPVAIDITESDPKNWESPPSDSFYIDPEKSKLIMPRPIFWSKMENTDGFDNPELGATGTRSPLSYSGGSYTNEGQAATILEHATDSYGMKFNNGTRARASTRVGYLLTAHAERSLTLMPFSYTDMMDFSSGTFSVWCNVNSSGQHFDTVNGHWDSFAQAEFSFPNVNIFGVRVIAKDDYGTGTVYNQVEFMVGLATIGTYPIPENTPFHLYVQWDSNGIHGQSDTARVYVNGTLALSTTNALPDLSALRPAIETRAYTYASTGIICSILTESWVALDNLKIWNEAVGTDADWEYNGGAGREDALHAIYGSDSDYKPVLTGTDSGVGYHYLPEAPGTSTAPSIPANFQEEYTASSTAKLTWSDSVDSDGTVIGYNVYRSTTSGSGFVKVGDTAVNEFTDDTLSAFTPYYYMVRAVDDTGVESGDSSEVMVSIEPEIVVKEGSDEIANGGETAVNNVPVRATRKRVFTIENKGDIDMDLTGTPLADLTGTDAAMFTVVEAPDAVVPANGSTTFTVAFKAETPGEKTATVTITNSDADEGTYAFDIKGMGTYGKMDVGIYNPAQPLTFCPGGDIKIHRSVGNGNFKKYGNAILGSKENTLSFSGDFNGDGYWDIGFYNIHDGSIEIRLGDAAGTFNSEISHSWDSNGKIIAGDFNKDGYHDIALYNVNEDGIFRIRYSNGSGVFENETTYSWGSYISAQPFAGDFNGDGFCDIGLYNIDSDGKFYIRTGDGSGTFTEWSVEDRWVLWDDNYTDKNGLFHSYEKYQDNSRVFSGDYDGDGICDLGIYYVNYCIGFSRTHDLNHSGNIIYRNGDGSGSFNNENSYHIISDGLKDIDKENTLAYYIYEETNFHIGYYYFSLWEWIAVLELFNNQNDYNQNLLILGQPFTGNFDGQ